MSVYALAQLTIHDRARYERYAALFMDVLRRYDGRLLAADEHPQAVEGEWRHDKVMLVEFDDEPAFRSWSTSADYAAIAGDRLASTTGSVLLLRGL